MKNLFLTIVSFVFCSLIFVSCASSEEITREECKALGLEFKKEKVLNYRTGKYEIRSFCKEN
ncbi:MAG: hypothetical protein HWD90_02910 [Campylobacteraceae bacterium]|nr:hypothetical protein [Campylobacteraceae bacterium]